MCKHHATVQVDLDCRDLAGRKYHFEGRYFSSYLSNDLSSKHVYNVEHNESKITVPAVTVPALER